MAIASMDSTDMFAEILSTLVDVSGEKAVENKQKCKFREDARQYKEDLERLKIDFQGLINERNKLKAEITTLKKRLATLNEGPD